ncbi:MAG: hypothetical protein M1817_003826 [Caeruleum heppii]|nr:MAG: hypothetical protein M1817_003826 [Caeruleum heppii]
MSTSVWPPIAPDQLVKEEAASQARELEWLLQSLQETLASLKEGLEECIALLAPREPGSTLVMSTMRSDALKGFVTRVGTRIVRGDMQVRLNSLPPTRGLPAYKLSLSTSDPSNTLAMDQLVEVRNLINQSLDIVDVSTWTGDAKDANFISGQLRLLFDNIQEASQALKGDDSANDWAENPMDPNLFDPPLPHILSFHLSIREAALQLHLRTLEPIEEASTSLSGFDFRSRLAVAIGASKTPTHDEANETFIYRGQEVRVREKLRVESQDPSLMSVMAKLAALEHTAALARKALNIVMDKDD